MKAKLRVCASCEWIFKENEKTFEDGCPKCGFVHYPARYVYGRKAYAYSKSQYPWKEKKMTDYSIQLDKEIKESRHEKTFAIDRLI